MLPPAQRGPGPEPQLLTHREPDYDEDLNDDPDLDYDDEDGPLSDEDRKSRRKKIWRRVRRTMYVLTALMIIGPIVAFFVAYQVVEVPNAETVASKQGQVVNLQFADGAPLSTITPPSGNRVMVTYEQLPAVVKNAVFAAEDATFMDNAGFDITGVLRAGWNQATGGSGGGSTITQQYIKMATGNDEASGLSGYSRKALEVVKAYKMNNTYTKEEILTSYLNTIYFGRSAYGIAAASKAYYGKSLDQLSASEAALLAGMIQSPGRDSDEPSDVEYRDRRWNFVMDQMVDKGWLKSADRKAAAFPTLIPKDQARPKAIEGPGAHIQAAVLAEIKAETGMDLDDLQRNGYTIRTTIDRRAQGTAENALKAWQEGQPTSVIPAMTAIDPKTGEVLAYFGGWNGNGLDWASQPQEPGSSFKPFDLVALLQKGKGLGTKYDGTSGRKFGGPNSPEIRNAGGDSCGEQCTVKQAMKQSINTVFYDIALNEVGTQAVANAAHEAGIKSPLEGANGGPPDGNIAIGGGTTQVTTYEMASAYSTFAAGGIYRTPHLVKQILAPDGGVFYTPDQAMTEGKAVFSADSAQSQKIARNVTESLLPIPEFSKIPCANKRECAAKTGTQQFGETEFNSKAWTVGYTPQIAFAVSMTAEENGKQVPLKDKTGKSITGASGPGKVWQKFMNDYLKDAPKEGFGRFVAIGEPVDEDGDGETSKRSTNTQQQNTNTQQPNTQQPNDGDNGGGNQSPPPSSPDESTDPEGPDTGGNCIPPLCNNNNDDDN